MANVLFLGVPSHGHVNPTIGLVAELVRRGERVTYFASSPFQERIENAGAVYRSYAADLDMFKAPRSERSVGEIPPFLRVILSARLVIDDILAQTSGQQVDYLIHSAAFPFTRPLAQILGLPTVSSLAVFLGLDYFLSKKQTPGDGSPFAKPQRYSDYADIAEELSRLYGVTLPESPVDLIFNEGNLNLVYTSKYFAGDLPNFGPTYRFVGPPVSDRGERVEFPFERLVGRKVLYISLGTVFSNQSDRLYDVFFDAFADWDGVVVMAAYGVDPSRFSIPDNFIVRDYVPQNEVLRNADAAITHCGMNSMNDLLVHEVPFVCLPLGADQPLLAARAQELGATIALDAASVSPQELRQSVERTMHEPSFLDSIRRIGKSFAEAGGYPKAVDEIFQLKRELGIEG